MDIRFFCEDDNCELKLYNSGMTGIMYSCPKYFKENRTKEEKWCQNNISVFERKLVAIRINELLSDNELEIGSKVIIYPRIFQIAQIDNESEEIFVTVRKAEGAKYEYGKNYKNITNKNVV